MSKASVIFAFSMGAVVGAIASWKVLEKKYDRLFKEEINACKERFAKRYTGPQQSEPTKDAAETRLNDKKEEVKAYADELRNNGYISSDEKEVGLVTKPYVITPEEFGDNEDYDTESLTLYSDGILTDDFDNVIEDVDGLVGRDSLTHFGEYEDDSVFVRNDALRTDYEILQDERTYAKACGETRTSPDRREN